MAIDRHQARILAMQALCQLDAQGADFLAQVPPFLAEAGQSARTVSYAQRLVERAWENHVASDAELTKHAPRWSAKRLTPVDRNILRTALAEFEEEDVPPKVIINEAIEIGREYGSAESIAFINGVLDAIWKSRPAEEGH